MKRIFLISMCFALSCMVTCTLLPSAANATLITQLNVSNADLGVTGNFATVTVDYLGDHKVQFQVDLNNDLLGGGDNLGIQKFGFNSSIGLIANDFSLPSTKWDVKFDQNFSRFGLFYADEIGTGNTRQDPLIFTVTNENIDDINNELMFYIANEEGYHYAAQAIGFDKDTGHTGAFFTDMAGIITPVPLPATILLLGSSFLGLLGFRRK